MAEGESKDEDLVAQLYEELHRRANRYMRGQRGDHTLQPTALINEAYMKLAAAGSSLWTDRTRFVATASRAMRQVLVDHARKKGQLKNSPPGNRTPLDQITIEFEENAIDLLALDDALNRLAERDPDMARAVELRYFGGSTLEEAAENIGLSKRSFERRWKFVRTWLHAEVT